QPQQQQQGNTEEYDQLIGNMHHTERLVPDEVAMLVTILRALSGAVSYIDIVHHRSLLSSICAMRFWNYGPDVMDALMELLVTLFVMFYACSLDPEDCGTQFVSRLLEIFKSTIYPQDWRMSAVAYLASYLSRARFLLPSYVTIILE
ncbi:hypothetical protein M8C21_015247, partial [Ambrosia artemisiifolia]